MSDTPNNATDFETLRDRADVRLDEAIEASGARDPREFYRVQLRELREHDEAAYQAAVAYYRDTLLVSIARDGTEPLAAWTEYGRRLAVLAGPGRTVALDPTGRSIEYQPPAPLDHLILHLPDDRRQKARLVGLPPELSAAQRAAYGWLVQGRNKLSDEQRDD